MPTETKEQLLEVAFTLSMHLADVERDLDKLACAVEGNFVDEDDDEYDDYDAEEVSDSDYGTTYMDVSSTVSAASVKVSLALDILAGVKYNTVFDDVRDKVVKKVWGEQFGKSKT